MGQMKGPNTSPSQPSMAGGAAPAWTHAPPLSDPQHFPQPHQEHPPDPPTLYQPPSPSPLLCLLISALSPQPLLLVPGSEVPPS